MESDQDYGQSSPASFAWYDLDTSSWKTWQLCLSEEWAEFSQTWPIAGIKHGGLVFQRAQWVPHICDGACSLWPTPTARDWKDGRKIYDRKKNGEATQDTVGRRLAALGETVNGLLNPTWVEWLMGFPLGWTDLKDSETP